MSTANPKIHYAQETQDSLPSPLRNKMKKIPWKTIGLFALAFLIPVIIMAVVYICIGVYPFGEKSLLTIDLYHQYIDFLGYYRQSLLSAQPQNLLYSFSKALGGNTLGLFAYYLASPINLVFLLFKPEMLSEAVLAVTLLKIGACGITFMIMCRKMFNQKGIFTLLFSTCYALMAYNIVFQQNIMWLDGVIWLPIIALGIYHIVEKGSFLLYSLALAIALLSNYYVGYMLCIFSVLLFIYMMIISEHHHFTMRLRWQRIGKFILGSAIAGALAAVLLLPTFISLQNGKANFDPSIFSLNQNFEFTQLLQKMFIGEMDIELLHQGLATTLPDIFSGTLTTILCFLYFFNKKISLKEKAASIVMVLILIMSFHIKALDLFWHGFNTPVGFLYRNSFVFSFFAIFLGVRCFMNIEGITKSNILSTIAIFVGLAIFVNNFSLESLTAFEIYLTIIFFLVYSLVIGLIVSGKKTPLLFVSILLLLVVEFEVSGYLTLEDLSHVSRQTFVDGVTSTDKAVARLNKIDSDIYRVDKNYMRSRNDGMMHSFNTITHSSSTADFKVVEFLNKMGYRNESNIGNSYDFGSTLPADSLMGIKYVLSNNNQDFPYFTNSGYSDNIKMFQNPYALPLMFKGGSGVLTVQDSYNIFELQNNLYGSLSGQGDVLSQIIDYQVTMENLTKTTSGKNINYTKNEETDPAYIEYTFTAINSEVIYAHLPTEPISDSSVDVYVNGIKIREHLDSDHLTYYDVLTLGQFRQGDTVKLRLVLKDEETNFENIFIYALNKSNFNLAHALLSQDPVKIEMLAQNHLKVTVSDVVANQLLFTTVPYDKGWSITVNGESVQPEKVLDTLMAIPLSPGGHVVEMKYTPPGLWVGVIITGFGILLLIISVIYLDDVCKKKRLLKSKTRKFIV